MVPKFFKSEAVLRGSTVTELDEKLTRSEIVLMITKQIKTRRAN